MIENIYTYLKNNLDIETSHSFKRDYIINPLKKVINDKTGRKCFEIPDIDDIIFLYKDCFLNSYYIGKLLNVSKQTVDFWFKELNIDTSNKEHIKRVREKTNMLKFGCSNYSSTNECREKVKKTNLERYGVECSFLNEEVKSKIRETNLKRYGCEFPSQNEEIKQKQIDTNIKNHNGVTHHGLSETLEKRKKTNLERYGSEVATHTPHVCERRKQTNLERYGCENPSRSELIKNKISIKNKINAQNALIKRKETNIERYNREYKSQLHIESSIINMLNNKDKLVEFIKDNNVCNILDLSSKLNINNSSLGRYINKYDIKHLFNYSGSVAETEIRKYINQYFETENNTRKYLDGKEIDIFIPKKNIGIEFNGDFWHNEYGKEKLYHQHKSMIAEEKGIFLYHIFEYEWNTKREQIINQLNNLLGLNENKIYARKCEVREVYNEEKERFLELYHMQGNDNSSIKLGLYYNGELVSLMTFVKPRFNKKYEWELSRFCSKANCNVIGGASKLFKYFTHNYNPKSIISYSNIAHTKGNLYKTLGMTLQGISEPNYVWCKNSEILTRYQCQKHKLIKDGFEGKSELDIMHNRGYYRIYDCGNKVWVWK